MARTAFVLLGVLAASAAQGQLEIRQHSEAFVNYYDPMTNEPISVSDTINASSGFELVSRQQFVSYDDPTLDYDPTASSSFSVDSISVLQDLGNSYLIKVDLSADFFRKGPGISQYFSAAKVLSSVEVEFDVAFVTASWEAGYVTTQSNIGGFIDNYAARVAQADPFEQPLLTLEIDGLSNSTSGMMNSNGGSTTARIDARADLSDVLIQHNGETTLSYSVSVIGIVSEIPAPGTAALPAMAGLLLARRRRGR